MSEATNALTTRQIIFRNLEKMRPQFERILPAHISADKLVRSVMNAVQNNPTLERCDMRSLLSSAMSAAVLGLEVDNVTGQGYIVPFRGKAQFIVGYKGYVTLGFNSGYQIDAHIVREKDHFFYRDGIPPLLEFEPGARGTDWKDAPHVARKADRGEIVGVYAKAVNLQHPGSPPMVAVMHIDDVLKDHRDRSSGYKAYKAGKVSSSTWETDFEGMVLKTPIRALGARLPLNVQRAAAFDAAQSDGRHVYADEEGDIIEGEFDLVSDEPAATPERQAESTADKGRYDD